MSDKKINVTLKAGAAYDAPWITVGGDSEAEVAFNLKDILDKETGALAAQVSRAFAGFWAATSVLGATPVEQPAQPQYNAPAVQHYQQVATEAPAPATAPWDQPQPNPPAWSQPQQQAPVQATVTNGPPGPSCRHGAMTFRSGSKNGRNWSAHFCPTPKGAPDQCDPVFGR